MKQPIDYFLDKFNKYATVVKADRSPGALPSWMNSLRLFCVENTGLTEGLLGIQQNLAEVLTDYKIQGKSISECLSKIDDALQLACRQRSIAFQKHHTRTAPSDDGCFEKGRFEDHVIQGLEALKPHCSTATAAINRLIEKAKYPVLSYDKKIAALNPQEVELMETVLDKVLYNQLQR